MKISIITINYNGSENTINLLKSLNAQSDKNFKIIVIDNDSEFKDKEKLKNYLKLNPSVMLLENSENLGFTGGSNSGIRKVMRLPEQQSDWNGKGGWILLLNNDTRVENNFISRLKEYLKDKRGIVSIPLAEKNKIAYCGKIIWLKPRGRHIHNINKVEKEKNKYAIGGAMAVKEDVFDKIGFFDEKYFLYFEDADISIRAKMAGFKILTAYNLKVGHEVSASAKKLGSPLLLHYHYRNALYFNYKNGPLFVKLLIVPWSLIILIKQTVKIMTNKNKKDPLGVLRGVMDFYKNKMGKI